jgi:hypothetical protein
MTVALILAIYLQAPVGLVSTIYDVAGIDGVAVVYYESQFNERACRRELRGHTSWGLWQLDDEWHEQYRDDLLLHIVRGTVKWKEDMCAASGNISVAYSIYNSGSPRKSIDKGKRVRALRDRLAWRVAEAYGVGE